MRLRKLPHCVAGRSVLNRGVSCSLPFATHKRRRGHSDLERIDEDLNFVRRKPLLAMQLSRKGRAVAVESALIEQPLYRPAPALHGRKELLRQRMHPLTCTMHTVHASSTMHTVRRPLAVRY
jgi:hypothetical protein